MSILNVFPSVDFNEVFIITLSSHIYHHNIVTQPVNHVTLHSITSFNKISESFMFSFGFLGREVTKAFSNVRIILCGN